MTGRPIALFLRLQGSAKLVRLSARCKCTPKVSWKSWQWQFRRNMLALTLTKELQIDFFMIYLTGIAGKQKRRAHFTPSLQRGPGR